MKITIDGKKIEVEGKRTVLEVAREKGIYIPSLCDHPRLAPFGGCRLCIVEIKEKGGFPPSCSTFVENGMEIKTKTPRLQKLRREILELILSEHPNACLICSEKEKCDEYKSTIRKVGEVTGCVLCSNNGRCELQDVVETLKIDKVRFPSVYRNLEVKKGDPFFDRDYNLCILCGRCVRVCQELRGAAAVSFVYRGSQAVVGTVLDLPLIESGCQFCGACLDICPTGSLAERGIRYEDLPDERVKTICPLCSMGCELKIDLKKKKILSSKPSDEGAVNQGQACVKGRFLIKDLIQSPRRIIKPLFRMNKELEETSWEEALDFVAQRLRKFKGKEIALVASPQVSCEEYFLLHKFASEELKTENVDSSYRFSPLAVIDEMAQENGLELDLNFELKDISRAKALFLIGEDIPKSHPIIWLEVLKAVQRGAKLMVASPAELSLNRYSSLWLKIKPGTEFYFLSFLSKLFLQNEQEANHPRIEGFDSFKSSLGEFDLSQVFEMTGITREGLEEAFGLLSEAEDAAFLFGMGLTQYPWGTRNVAALWNLALQAQAQLFPLGLENNLRGVFEIGQNSSGQGLNFNQIFQAALSGDLKALYLAGPAPYLKKANLEFLVIQDSFVNENFKLADAVLPASTFAETDGTFINGEGRVQKFNKIIDPLGDAKPDWWIISQLARRMGNRGFPFKNPPEITKELIKTIPGFSNISCAELGKGQKVFIQEKAKKERSFIPVKYMDINYKKSKKYPFLLSLDYSLDYYRSLVLSQESKGMKAIRDSRWIKISSEDAEKLNLEEGESIVIESSSGKFKGFVKILESLPDGILRASFLLSEDADFSVNGLIPSGFQESHSLGMLPVKIKREK
ncbi:MAG: molybdopterin-dependent oxidoreductase [Candidatus Aminicenantes bacterium]|nr:molybdopterin-dependent oxidoreductase [Candidatus Aminicenantes bacterium]